MAIYLIIADFQETLDNTPKILYTVGINTAHAKNKEEK